MSFNVSDFKSKIAEVGGLAKANKFAVMITPPPWTAAVGDSLSDSATAPFNLRFLCDTTNLPGYKESDYCKHGNASVSELSLTVTSK